MTNGEKIKVAFPNYYIEIDEHKGHVRVFYEDFYTTYPLRWWNAEYKEPTTKNDLGVDCTPNTISFKGMMDNLKITAEDIENAEDLEYSIEPLIHPKNDLGVDKTFYEYIVEYCKEHFLVLVEKDVWEDAKKALTTKNDLGVDCIDRKKLIDWINIWDITPIIKNPLIRHIQGMSSVKPQEPRIITCSECKYYRNKGNKNTYCTKRLNVESVIDRYREPNFYCADAVLREEEK